MIAEKRGRIFDTVAELFADALNLLENPSFEDTWTTDPTGNQIPRYWRLTWMHSGDEMLSAGAFPDDDPPVLETVVDAPECVHKLSDQLPPDERLGGANALILDGDRVYKVFGSQFSATLSQSVTGLTPGANVRFTVPVQAHHEKDGSFGAVAFRAFAYGTESPWLTFSGGLPDPASPEYVYVTVDAIVPFDGTIVVGMDVEGRAEDRPAFFVDALRLEYVDEEPPETGVNYVVTVELLPQDATIEEAEQVLAATLDDRRTLLYSADDARRLVAPGLPGSKVDLWAIDRHKPGIVEWLLDRGVRVVELFEFEGGDPPPEPPLPPVTGEPVPFVLRDNGRNLVGLHTQFPMNQTENYVRAGLPTTHKVFSIGDGWFAKQWGGPDVVIFVRKYVGDPGIDKPLEQARWYVDQYTAEINTASANMGLTVEQLLSGIDGLESYNETIPTYNAPVIERGVEVDVYFAEALHARYGDLVGPGLLNAAIGNPHETEVPLLIPAAQAAVDYGGFIDYHGYWTRNETQQCIAEHWQWHAGRWMEWDTVFRAAGIYPRYVSTEGGIVYADNCTSFHSGLGWRACGPFDLYLEDMHEYMRRVKAWNALHANRCAGIHIFGYGMWGWDSFLLGDGDVAWMAAEFGNAAQVAFDYSSFTDFELRVLSLEKYLREATYITPEYRDFLTEKLAMLRAKNEMLQ